jgi:hypothetical protein
VTKNFFSLLVYVREKGREREGHRHLGFGSLPLPVREREVWDGLRRFLQRILRLVLCVFSGQFSAKSQRLLGSGIFSGFGSLLPKRERGSTETAGLDSGVISGKL